MELLPALMSPDCPLLAKRRTALQQETGSRVQATNSLKFLTYFDLLQLAAVDVDFLDDFILQ